MPRCQCSRAWETRWPLHLVRARPSHLSGQACWAHLYLLCLLSIPVIHHPCTHPQGSTPLTPDLRAGVPCHPFANGDITFQVLKFKPDECCTWSEGWPLSGRTLLGVLFQTPCCLFRGWWSHSPWRQRRFSSQPRPDNVSWLMFFTLSGKRIEATRSAAPTTPVSSPDITLTPSTGHSTPNPPFSLTLLHTYKLTHTQRHTHMRFSTSVKLDWSRMISCF